MRVALGATVLSKAHETGHLDGIAVYTQQLSTQLPFAGVTATNYAFVSQHTPYQPLGKFSYQALASLTTSLPFYNSNRINPTVDLFHATDHYIPKLAKLPVVATIMDPIPLVHPEWAGGRGRGLKNIVFKKTAHWADHVIAISNYAAEAIEEHFCLPSSRISVVSLGVDDNCFQRVSEEKKQQVLQRYNLPASFFLCIGTLQPRKNVERLVNAFMTLPSDLRKEYPLVIVGRDGWGCIDLVARLRQLTEKGQLHWLDYVSFEDKYALLQSSLAMVFPSLYEGFGLPVLEAFAANTPVITSNVTSLPEVAGGAALLVDPYSIDEIAHAMALIAQDSALQNSLKIKGAVRVKEFSWAKTARQTAQIYKTVS